MHGIVGVYGVLIPICFGVAFLVSLISGLNTLKSGLTAALILLIVAIAVDPPEPNRLGDLVIELPIYILGLTIGLFGAVPGAAAGGWLRNKISKREV